MDQLVLVGIAIVLSLLTNMVIDAWTFNRTKPVSAYLKGVLVAMIVTGGILSFQAHSHRYQVQTVLPF